MADETTTYPGMEQMLRERQSLLDSQFGSYLGNVQKTSGDYGNVINSLVSKLNSPSSQVGFSLGGGGEVSFLPRQAREQASTLEQLAGKQLQNNMLSPSAQWAYQQSNPLYGPEMTFMDYLGGLSGQMENRRYGLPTSTESANYNSGNPSLYTTMGNIGTLANTGLKAYDQYSSLNQPSTYQVQQPADANLSLDWWRG